MPKRALAGSRMRSTIFSPKSVGNVLTRKSMERALARCILMRPSWGRRRSEMSSAAITLRRAAKRLNRLAGGCRASVSAPSMRKRTRQLDSYGSK